MPASTSQRRTKPKVRRNSDVIVVLLLSVRELFLVHLLAQRPEGEHLGDGQRVHVRGADADGLAEHVAVLQRPLVAHDALKLVRSMALENHGECGCAGSLLDKVT